jgi:hypothetical protein
MITRLKLANTTEGINSENCTSSSNDFDVTEVNKEDVGLDLNKVACSLDISVDLHKSISKLRSKYRDEWLESTLDAKSRRCVSCIYYELIM